MVKDDQWVAIGTPGDKDWIQIGAGYHYAGKSHNEDYGYPGWGDSESSHPTSNSLINSTLFMLVSSSNSL